MLSDYRAIQHLGNWAWVALIAIGGSGDVTAQTYPRVTEKAKAVTENTSVSEAANTGESNLVVLTMEDRRGEDYAKRQVIVNLRTEVVYPSPQIRHATAMYKPIHLERTESEQRIYAALERPLPEPWRFSQSTVRDLQQRVTEQLGIPCEVDIRRLEDLGIDTDCPVPECVVEGSIKAVLRQLLHGVDLDYFVKDDTLLITTREFSWENMEIVFYPVPTACDVRELIDLIQTTIAADTWATVGGQGNVLWLAGQNEIVVLQCTETHDEIGALIAEFDADLNPSRGAEGLDAQRLYRVKDPAVLADLQKNLVATCNAVLGKGADPGARAWSVAGAILVQSTSRPFHIYAAEVVRAVNGVEVIREEVYGEGVMSGQRIGFPTGMGMGGCGFGP